MRMQTQLNVIREAGGTEKPPTRLSMTVPCSTNSGNEASAVLKIMAVARTGSILTRIFSSSTCVTVQSLQGFRRSPDILSQAVTVAARSRNLQKMMTFAKYYEILLLSII
jgi:hypothetical protein